MFNKKGVYVFPTEEDRYRLFLFADDVARELPSTTYAEQIINFTEIDMSILEKVTLNLRDCEFYTDNDYDYELVRNILNANYFTIAKRCFVKTEPIYSFLLSLEMENEIQGTLIRGTSDFDDMFEKSVGIIENMLIMQNEIRSRCYSYCRFDGTHEEKLYEMLSTHGEIFDIRFTEFYTAALLDEWYREGVYEFPVKRGYFFETLPDYMWFVFINFMRYDVNFSDCIYCGHFFIPATKRKTRYCDRVRTEYGKTCKQVGPPYVKKKLEENEPMFDEYSKAIARNYKRLERTENRVTERHSDKELDAMTYNKWLDKAREAKRQWLDKKLTDEEFAAIIHELD